MEVSCSRSPLSSRINGWVLAHTHTDHRMSRINGLIRFSVVACMLDSERWTLNEFKVKILRFHPMQKSGQRFLCARFCTYIFRISYGPCPIRIFNRNACHFWHLWSCLRPKGYKIITFFKIIFFTLRGHWYAKANCLDKFAWKIAFLMRIGAIRSFCMKITSLILESLHLEKEHSRYAYTRNTIWKYSPSVMSVFVWAHLFSIPLNYIQCFRKYLMLIGLIISMFSWQLRVFFPPSNLIIQDLWCAKEFTTPMNHSLKITYFNYLIDKKLYFLKI